MLDFLNGKKTVIGAVAILASMALGATVSEDQINTVIGEAVKIIESFGVIVTIIGLLHKSAKAANQ